MKVDKAVCTNDTLEDLNRALRYEAVFSTLVENKILAIKRECERKQHPQRKYKYKRQQQQQSDSNGKAKEKQTKLKQQSNQLSEKQQHEPPQPSHQQQSYHILEPQQMAHNDEQGNKRKRWRKGGGDAGGNSGNRKSSLGGCVLFGKRIFGSSGDKRNNNTISLDNNDDDDDADDGAAVNDRNVTVATVSTTNDIESTVGGGNRNYIGLANKDQCTQPELPLVKRKKYLSLKQRQHVQQLDDKSTCSASTNDEGKLHDIREFGDTPDGDDDDDDDDDDDSDVNDAEIDIVSHSVDVLQESKLDTGNNIDKIGNENSISETVGKLDISGETDGKNVTKTVRVQMSPFKKCTTFLKCNKQKKIQRNSLDEDFLSEQSSESSSRQHRISGYQKQRNLRLLRSHITYDYDDIVIDNPADDEHSCESSISKLSLNVQEASFMLEQERHRLRVLEAKSVSAQCSPIMSRQQSSDTTTAVIGVTQSTFYTDDLHRSINTNNNNNNNRLYSRQNTSDDSANITYSTILTTGGDIIDRDPSSKLIKKQLKSSLDTYKRNDTIDSCSSSCSNDIKIHPDSSEKIIKASVINSSSIQNQSSTGTISKLLPALIAIQMEDESAAFIESNNDKQQIDNNTVSNGNNYVSDNDKLQRMTSMSTASSVEQTGCCVTYHHSNKDRKSSQAIMSSTNLLPQDSTDQTIESSSCNGNISSCSDEEFTIGKKRHKRGHRYSEPVLVYPSTNGLQHCVLSIPPSNQPIQLNYDEDFIYDVSLQMDSDKVNDLEVMVPHSTNNNNNNNTERKHRHHHHRHRHHHHHHPHQSGDRENQHGRKKKHKRKILVHDLDSQSIKVIDPDDLPQRARWTIIATACLLLIMCLLLVGVTLRMAPIIDDMGLLDSVRFMLIALRDSFGALQTIIDI